jgi:hypothetical protein
MAALAALLAPAGQAEAAKKKIKQPVITSVSPMKAAVGDTLTLRGRYFVRGKAKNTVAFKRDGAPAVFVKADVATTRQVKVVLPARLTKYMANQGTVKVPTRFRLRVLARRFGKSFTVTKLSPEIGPEAPADVPPIPVAAAADGDCDGDGTLNGKETDDDADGLSDDVELSLQLDPCKVDTDADGLEDRWEYDCDRDSVLNRDESDDDDDLLSDDRENQIGTNGCSADSDGDGAQDGFEYQSAVDLNDDEYQQPNTVLPYPGARGYPNPLFNDASEDYDGDGLPLISEYKLWVYSWQTAKTATRTLDKLSYSDGLQYSKYTFCPAGDPDDADLDALCGTTGDNANRRVPTLKGDGYEREFGAAGFWTWAQKPENGYGLVRLTDAPPSYDHTQRNTYDLRDVNRVNGVEPSEATLVLTDAAGYLSDDQRDEDADGLSNIVELRGAMQPQYWSSCYTEEGAYPVSYSGTDYINGDTDGDGVRDGADDQDHDDVPNLMELSRKRASGLDDSKNGRDCTPLDALDPELPNHPDAYGWVHVFNPCLPDPASRSCPLGTQIGSDFAPFAGPNWWALQ